MTQTRAKASGRHQGGGFKPLGVPALNDSLSPKGKVELFVTKGSPALVLGEKIPSRRPNLYSSADIDFSGCRLLSEETLHNIIVNTGKDKVIAAIEGGMMDYVARMAIGDRGTIPSDVTVPKVPVPTMTALYNEVFRDDVDAVVLNIGTPTVHEVKFIKTFSATGIPITAFSNQALPMVNEVALITINADDGPLPRASVTAPALPPADERMFSIRTFKSVPFEAANDIAITIRYTIYIE